MRHYEPSLNQATAQTKITEYLQQTINHLPAGTRFVNAHHEPGTVGLCGDIKTDSPQNVSAWLDIEPADGMVDAVAAVWRTIGWEVRHYSAPDLTYVTNTPDHYGLDVYRHREGNRVTISAWSPCYPPNPQPPEAHIPKTFTPAHR